MCVYAIGFIPNATQKNPYLQLLENFTEILRLQEEEFTRGRISYLC